MGGADLCIVRDTRNEQAIAVRGDRVASGFPVNRPKRLLVGEGAVGVHLDEERHGRGRRDLAHAERPREVRIAGRVHDDSRSGIGEPPTEIAGIDEEGTVRFDFGDERVAGIAVLRGPGRVGAAVLLLKWIDDREADGTVDRPQGDL